MENNNNTVQEVIKVIREQIAKRPNGTQVGDSDTLTLPEIRYLDKMSNILEIYEGLPEQMTEDECRDAIYAIKALDLI